MLQLPTQIIVDKHTRLKFISPQHFFIQIVEQIHSSFKLYLILIPLLERNKIPHLLITIVGTLLSHFLNFYISYLHTCIDNKMPLLH